MSQNTDYNNNSKAEGCRVLFIKGKYITEESLLEDLKKLSQLCKIRMN